MANTQPPASTGTYGASGVDTVTWAPATFTLTDTVTSGGAFIASFAGQAYNLLTTPLPGSQYGNPS